jgi:3-deoxy-D-manno-octulosonate 8-phosphate phosphatase (KDO 8-P phosphatase)
MLEGITIDIYLGTSTKWKHLMNVSVYNINPEQVLYMGDDIPDYCNEISRLPTCPQDASP